MTSAEASVAPAPQPIGWFTQAENWLDNKGKGAWMAAMILGFIFFWPVGLALLFYMLWSKKMFGKSCASRPQSMTRSSGNSAFDAYREDTIKRLEDEQQAFEDFLERLRAAKDKSEFDQFMDDRAKDNAIKEPA